MPQPSASPSRHNSEVTWRQTCLRIDSLQPTPKSDTWSDRGVSEVTIGRHEDTEGRNAACLCAHPWLCQGVRAWRGSAAQPVLTRFKG